MTTADTVILEGHLSVRAALEGKSRTIHRILVRGGRIGRVVRNIERLAEAAGVPVERVERDEVMQRVTGRTHGGIIAEAGPRRYAGLDALARDGGVPFVAMLDGFEDPFNYGQALRSLYAAGATGVVVAERDWESAAGTVARASAGASERLPLANTDAAEAAAAHMQAAGLRVVCTAETGGRPLYEADLTGPLFLVIGGEKRGITRSFLARADLILTIPSARPDAPGLAGSHAAAVIAYERLRQVRSRDGRP